MANDLTNTFGALRRLNQPVPIPLRLPTEAEVMEGESKLGFALHPDFRWYLLEVSDVVYGTIEPVTITAPGAHTDLVTITEDGRKYWLLPSDYIPICESNFYICCVTPDGSVVFWPHDAISEESWASVADWIEDVWLHQHHE